MSAASRQFRRAAFGLFIITAELYLHGTVYKMMNHWSFPSLLNHYYIRKCALWHTPSGNHSKMRTTTHHKDISTMTPTCVWPCTDGKMCKNHSVISALSPVLSSPLSAHHLSPQIVEVSPAVRDTPWHRWYSSPVGFPLKSQLHTAFFPPQLFLCLKVFLRLTKELHTVSPQRMFPICVDFTTGFLQAMPPRHRPLWCGCVARPSSLLQRSASSAHHVCLDVGTEVARYRCQKTQTITVDTC